MANVPSNGRIAKSLDGLTRKGYNGRGGDEVSPNVERLCQAIARILRRLQKED